ncbi:carboxymuconolactone decarboxylase family protein [Parahaliea aestuarii]|uniref:Carboxymuconolactone decarboxylase family protein n=1 Tax=Parahaliea aestuarii TaxID=1852021 RepID=A0A5C8ZQ40_9GAMM|nr:hypothetical protein [Parahaliea aestuarii]TXS89617.1 hypothetical protein FVW59_16500 [Parahaliea aestuarii]
MTWFSPATSRDGVLSTVPDFQRGFDALYASLWSQQAMPAAILELCRLRIAQMHRCEVEWQRKSFALPQEQRDQLKDWHRSPAFSAAERACLDLCEVYTADPAAISDAQADAVKAHFGEAGFVALAEAMGLFFGLTRLSLLWQLQPEGLLHD